MSDTALAEARFADWFRKNYPGPDTIIHKPDWHSPKIFRAALAAYDAASAPDLSDPNVVHLNMLRGTIAKPSVDQIIHIYGIDALCKAMAPQIVQEAGNAPMTDYERKVEQKNKDFPNGF